MKRVIYSTRRDAFRSVCPDPELYLAPRPRVAAMRRLVSCPVVPIQDLTNDKTWFWLNDFVRRDTRIVYDRVAHHYKVESEKARRLARLAETSGCVSLVDQTPFYEHVRFLYMTWRYVDREILGYPHFYAFAGDHFELVGDQIVRSLDYGLLARKIAPYCIVEAPWPIRPNRRVVPVRYREDEHSRYRELRESLFETRRTSQPILTRLADLVHGFESRREAVREELARDHAVVAVVCNLAHYAAEYAMPERNVEVGTYAKPPKNLAAAERVVFAESPIVNTWNRLDLESDTRIDAEVVDVRGDAKLDAFLGNRVATEIEAVAEFFRSLGGATP